MGKIRISIVEENGKTALQLEALSPVQIEFGDKTYNLIGGGGKGNDTLNLPFDIVVTL